MKMYLAGLMALAGMLMGHGQLTCTPTSVTAAVETFVPRIRFATTVFDFRKISMGELVRHDFVFTNTGSATLEITAVRPGCGCTTAGDWDRKVAPGKTGVIPLQLNTAGLSGEITKYATVVCNDPEDPSLSLELEADVWKPFEIQPTMTVFTVSDEMPTNATKIVRIVSNLEEPITLSDLRCTNASFRTELKTVRPGKEFELHITAVPPFSSPSAFAIVWMKTSSPKAPEIRVTAQLMVQPAVVMLPNRITLPEGPLAKAISPGVTIRNNGTNLLELFGASINMPGAAVRLQEIQTNRLFRITAQFPTGFQLKAEDKVEVSVKSNHPKYPVIRVPVVHAQVSTRRAQPSVSRAPVAQPATP